MGFKKAMVNMMPSPLVRVFAKPYVARKGIQSGLDTAARFWEEDHLHSTVDLLGEEVYARDDVEATVQVYLDLLDGLAGKQYASVSCKPTQLGIFESEAYCLNNIRRIVSAAAGHGIHVTIDMEDHTFTDVTLRFFHELRGEFENVGTVLQSRLFRTRDDILNLPDVPCKIRICIGIYNEPADIAIQRKPEMKDKLFEYTRLLLERGHYPEIATHDDALIRRCMAWLDEHGISRDRYEYQMLMGVPRKQLQAELVERGEVVRLYVPFAEKWEYAMAYCKRRLAANPMMAAYVLHNMLGKARGR